MVNVLLERRRSAYRPRTRPITKRIGECTYVLDLTPPTTAGNGSSIQIDGVMATDQRAVTVDITAVDIG